jgi:hypothetical protein
VFVALLAGGCGSDFYAPVTGTVYGTVLLPAGGPAEGVLVLVEGTGLSTHTDEGGRFIINDLPSVREGQIGEFYNIRGEYELDSQTLAFVTIHFKVKEQQSYSVGRVFLRPTGSITGSVTLDGESDPSGVEVTLEGLGFRAVTTAAGTFHLDRVPAHDAYTVVCRHPAFQDGHMSGVAVEPASATNLAAMTLTRKN